MPEMKNDPTRDIPPPCEDCGGYHTAAEHEAFAKAQRALKDKMSEILVRLGPSFDELAARLQLATSDAFERTVVAATLAHWVMDACDVPEDTFNRCLDALIDAADNMPNAAEERHWRNLCGGKKPADA